MYILKYFIYSHICVYIHVLISFKEAKLRDREIVQMSSMRPNRHMRETVRHISDVHPCKMRNRTKSVTDKNFKTTFMLALDTNHPQKGDRFYYHCPR